MNTSLAIPADISGDLDTVWVLVCAILVFLMQCGFMMVEAGSVSQANVQNIIFKNLMDAAIGATSFWAIGYGIAYGADGGQFIGTSNFFLVEFENGTGDWVFWFFQFVFAATAATIVSGCVAERCQMVGYFAYSVVLTAFIYPVVVHWVWADGFLSAFRDELLWGGNGLIDFAGSGVVHLVGGTAGLVATIKMGPRRGRFAPDGSPRTLKGHSSTLVAQGVLVLWVGWYGFNAGSTLAASGGAANLAAKVAVVTTISACSACITTLIINEVLDKKLDVLRALNGILAGLVSITAPCSVVDPWHAFFIGVIGAFVYEGSSRLLVKFQIDDPVDASPIHGFCGIWGVLSVMIFATEENMLHAGYAGVTGGVVWGTQIVGVLAILAWTLFWSVILFTALDKLDLLRVSSVAETIGLDKSEHGDYNMSAELTASSADTDRKILQKLLNNYMVVSGRVSGGNGKVNPNEVEMQKTSGWARNDKLSSTEQERIKTVFDLIDSKKSGVITKEQYKETLKHTGLQNVEISDADLTIIFSDKETLDFEGFKTLLLKDYSEITPALP